VRRACDCRDFHVADADGRRKSLASCTGMTKAGMSRHSMSSDSAPDTRERFDDTYNWTVKWNMTVPGVTYENSVDNRAWE